MSSMQCLTGENAEIDVNKSLLLEKNIQVYRYQVSDYQTFDTHKERGRETVKEGVITAVR